MAPSFHALLEGANKVGATLHIVSKQFDDGDILAQVEVAVTEQDSVYSLNRRTSEAGGRMLVGSAFVHRLQLTDGELATLLAHEVAHAVAEHHRETFSEALLVNRLPAVPLEVVMARLDSDLTLQIRLWKLSSLQESEADHLGMVLAYRAGWAAADIVSFYRKLAEGQEGAAAPGAYPEYASRLSMAQGMARLFGD